MRNSEPRYDPYFVEWKNKSYIFLSVLEVFFILLNRYFVNLFYKQFSFSFERFRWHRRTLTACWNFPSNRFCDWNLLSHLMPLFPRFFLSHSSPLITASSFIMTTELAIFRCLENHLLVTPVTPSTTRSRRNYAFLLPAEYWKLSW